MDGQQGNSTAAGGGGNATAATDTPTIYTDAATANTLLPQYLLVVLGSLSVALIAWRLTTMLIKYVRTVACLTNDRQRYFAFESSKWSWFKRNLLYSPMFRKRHNREFQVSTAVNVGTLPTRLQFFFLLGYVATNVVFCVIAIDYSSPFAQVASTVRNRTGVMAMVNLVPLFLLAGRNNPLIKLLGISFDTFNLLHRWLGRIVALEILAHALAFLASSASTKGWAAAFNTTFSTPYLRYGFIVSCPPPYALVCPPTRYITVSWGTPVLTPVPRPPAPRLSLPFRPPASFAMPTTRASRLSTSDSRHSRSWGSTTT